jgi:uncharacterized iron-regulated membrane protein
VNARHIKAWGRIHRWSSLVCTVFLLLLCVTGLPLIFHDEINGLVEEKVSAPPLDGKAEAAPLHRIVESALARYPGEFPQYVFWPPDEPDLVHAGLAPVTNPQPGQIRRLVIDARTAQILSEPAPNRGAMQFLLRLHSELLSGTTGTLILAVAGVLFVVSLVSGAAIYAPFARKLEFAAAPRRRTLRIRWLNLHNLLGIVTVTWAAVVGVTGIVNTLEKPLFSVWRSAELPKLLAPYAGKPPPVVLSSIDDAVRTAIDASPGTRITSVLFPYSRFNSPRHYLIWAKGSSALDAHLFNAVMVDAESGRLSAVLALPWYLRVLEMSRPLHFGDYGGLPLKIIWALLDMVTIIVLASGVYLFVARSRLALPRLPARTDARRHRPTGRYRTVRPPLPAAEPQRE